MKYSILLIVFSSFGIVFYLSSLMINCQYKNNLSEEKGAKYILSVYDEYKNNLEIDNFILIRSSKNDFNNNPNKRFISSNSLYDTAFFNDTLNLYDDKENISYPNLLYSFITDDECGSDEKLKVFHQDNTLFICID